jgi:hypothetical protein
MMRGDYYSAGNAAEKAICNASVEVSLTSIACNNA